MASDTGSAKNERRRPRPDLVGAVDARAPHPRGERADAGARRAGDPLPRQLPQPAGEGARPQGRGRGRRWRRLRWQPSRRRRREALLANLVQAEREPDAALRRRRRARARQLAADRPDLSRCATRPPRNGPRTSPARSTAGSTRLSAKKADEDFVEPRGDRADAWPEVVASRRSRRDRDRNSPGARTDAGIFGRGAGGRRIDAAGDRQRPRLHPDGAQAARLAADRAWRGRGPVGPAVAVPRPDHRPAAAPDRARRAPGPARPGARGEGPAPALAHATRSACSPGRSAT